MNKKFEKIILYTAITDYGIGVSAADAIFKLLTSDQDPEDRLSKNEITVLDYDIEDMELVKKEDA
jgi:hypothetical protein